MGAWRVEQHYGVGAANLRLCAEPYAHPGRRWPLREGISRLRADLRLQGRSLRRGLALLPAILLGVAVLSSFVVTVVRDRIDDSALRVVMWTPEPIVPVPQSPPEPVPEVAKVEPKPKPEPIVEHRPPPPEPIVAKLPPPPPAAPKPVARPPVPAKPRPVVRIDAIAKAKPPPPPAPTRAARRVVQKEVRRSPSLPVVSPLAPSPVPAASAAGRFAGVRPPKGSPSARPEIEPTMAALPAAPARGVPVSSRTRSPLRESRRRPSVARPDLAPAALALDASEAPTRRVTRAARPVPVLHGRQRPEVEVATISVSVSRAHESEPGASSSRASVRGTMSAPTSSGPRSGAHQTLAGVPLGSLAACVSDREEDALKQRVAAAVKTQQQCISSAGRYRFVETKNLNSFLMWVAPTKGRAQADRCDELRLALECLQAGPDPQFN